MSQDPAPGGGRNFPVLERMTAVVLLLVLLALGWMVLAAHLPERAHWATAELEVATVLVLLALALALVSLVALLHTRR
jgi:hypothetical protein